MVTVKTTGHVGSDGLLRLEVPCQPSDRDVHVVVLISEQPIPDAGGLEAEDRWKEHRAAAARDPEAWAGIEIPAPGSWNSHHPARIRIDDGTTASEQLVKDRR